MIYRSEPGKIYDTAFWFMNYFFPEKTEKRFFSIYEDKNFMKKCINEVSEKAPDIPDLLAPFAFSEKGTTSTLLVFLNKELGLHPEDINIDIFLNDLVENKDDLFQSFLTTVIGEKYEDKNLLNNTEEYIKAIEKMYAPIDIKLRSTLIMNDFNYAVELLSESFKKVYDAVDSLYKTYDKELLYNYDQIQNEYNIELYKKAFNYSEEFIENTIVSIPLLNQFVVLNNFHNEKAFLLLGFKHVESFWNKGKNNPVDPRRFIVTSGNDTRVEILDLIAKHEKITISHLAKLMDIPITTVGRHVSSLRNDNIIYISKRDGLQLFYSINACYFKRLKVEMNTYIDEMIKMADINKTE